ncbi:C-X-C motif chemokine 13-like isoform X2 [Hyla sarda]|uniref:C-X-C motif chemokine 13-like isoform X2 n=1 Tax=Hyla sarda TaxID=327740 RepID=UPI0024C26A50|nr:C-X-C motif chemokine 13-like isoform X2 [Hyla sarda]XP_056407897.1 C-X-C motif chemokine 13-like isoform X2 [Hyla sarda]
MLFSNKKTFPMLTSKQRKCGQIEHRLPGSKCKCRKVTSNPVKKSIIWRVVVKSPVDCPVTEIIIQTKTKRYICIDPNAEWFENMFPQLIRNLKERTEKIKKDLQDQDRTYPNNSDISSTSKK